MLFVVGPDGWSRRIPDMTRPFFVRVSAEDYMMSHRPPDAESGAPAHDLTGGGEIYPADVYTHPHYYENMNDFGARQVHQTLKSIRGNPEAPVTIYRSAPNSQINPGDWVSLSHSYASQHAVSNSAGQPSMPVFKQTVKAKDIHTNGDSLHEWGYNGPAPLAGVSVKPAKPTYASQMPAAVSDRGSHRLPWFVRSAGTLDASLAQPGRTDGPLRKSVTKSWQQLVQAIVDDHQGNNRGLEQTPHSVFTGVDIYNP